MDHYNPTNVTHGAQDGVVRHVGDLGNVTQMPRAELSLGLPMMPFSYSANTQSLAEALFCTRRRTTWATAAFLLA